MSAATAGFMYKTRNINTDQCGQQVELKNGPTNDQIDPEEAANNVVTVPDMVPEMIENMTKTIADDIVPDIMVEEWIYLSTQKWHIMTK